MKRSNGEEQNQGDPEAIGGTFNWEMLPGLAKDRWEEAVAYDVTVETQLARAQSNRGQAEMERQRVAEEILEATREVCHEIASDARRVLESAKNQRVDADRKQQDAEASLKKAESTLAEAGADAESIVSRAKQEAEDILTRARSAAEKESEEIVERTNQHGRKILAQVEMMKAAAQEEIETQRIYTQVSRLKAESLDALSEVKGWVDQPQAAPETPEPDTSPGGLEGDTGEKGTGDSSRLLRTDGDPLWEDVAACLSVETSHIHTPDGLAEPEPSDASAHANGQAPNEKPKPRSKKKHGT